MKFKMFFITEMQNMICEGGASGHMSHLFEDYDLTFAELKDLIKDVLSGKTEITEKTDGQNAVITVIDGKVKMSRNTATLKAPMSIDEVASKFEGRGPIKDAFVNSMKDLQSAISSLSKDEQDDIFNDGKNFMSLEIIYPPTRNTVDYGNRAILQFHGVVKYDENWKKLGEDKEAASKLFDMLKAKDVLNQKEFEISGPAVLTLDKDFTKDIPKFLAELDKIKGKLPDSATIGDYLRKKWKAHIDTTLEDIELTVPDAMMQLLVNRLAVYDTSVTKPKIISLAKEVVPTDEFSEFKTWFNYLDSNREELTKDFVNPLEVFIIKLGGQLLSNLSGFITTNPNDTVSVLKSELNAVLDNIKSDKVDPALIKKMSRSLDKIETLGTDVIAPSEGVVFMHKGKPYKLTGLFGAVNQLLGMLKYTT